MLLIKIAGSLLLIASSTCMGLYYSGLDKRRIGQLLELKRALSIFKGEIQFAFSPFEEAAQNTGERIKAPVSNIFYEIGAIAAKRECKSGEEVWTQAIDKWAEKTCLQEEDWQALKSLGKTLGFLDKQMQMAAIDITIEYIEQKTGELLIKAEKTGPMYRSLGILGGTLLAVVLF